MIVFIVVLASLYLLTIYLLLLLAQRLRKVSVAPSRDLGQS